MDRGKRVMQPEADFDLNMDPLEWEKECKKTKKDKVFELEAEIDRMMATTKKKKKRNIEELKKLLIKYIDENKMCIETKELERNKDEILLWESIIVLKELVNFDPEASSSQSVSSDNPKN